MKLDMYQIDAFASKVFEGNPAAVIPLTEWLEDELMQKIAQENNLSETVFFCPLTSGEADYQIRWFTPLAEVELCGHATLASAYVLFSILNINQKSIVFDSLSGLLKVSQNEGWLSLNFPTQTPAACELPQALEVGLGIRPLECFQSKDYLALCESEQQLAELDVDGMALKELDLRGVIATAPSDHYDFVARVFAPKYGIAEDPVTGSAYTQLIPFWAGRLNKTKMFAKQISQRGGELHCELLGDRVNISGQAVEFMRGQIQISCD